VTLCGVVDYGMGNLRSVTNALQVLGYRSVPMSQPDQLRTADVLVLPGVGAFGEAMRNLAARGLHDVLEDLIRREQRPLLGICLGMQLLARNSDEEGLFDGLGWIDAEVRRIAPKDLALRVPHVGWNTVRPGQTGSLFSALPEHASFYFDHSYEVTCEPAIVAAETDYGGPMVAAVQRDNIFATQFHPEKSHVSGLKLLRRFFNQIGARPAPIRRSA
jgi:imidazole glycerol-phosphate synthase subunit HisH